MFVGFDLELKLTPGVDTDLVEIGKQMFSDTKTKIEKELNAFLESDGSIDGTRLQNSWFPLIEADIFISHSHNDFEEAFKLAGFLKRTFGLTVFLDSCVWGSADALLKKIDDKYCLNPSGSTYCYEDRNYSTSHVHMMLSSAISSMIDRCECLLFLNTPNSISTKDVIDKKTNSPWIYSEIVMSQLIRKKDPKRMIKKAVFEYQESGMETKDQLSITYDLNTRHLKALNFDDLIKWKNEYEKLTFPYETANGYKINSIHALDVLYNQKKLVKTE
ncbi:hypothetical protein QEZ44_04020 [Bacillus cereus]|uniref:hypothetical protein n=1 Tax=Bacillus cereus TaxID=1396 RepID=UPI0024528D16|nr:hypothetical protein [Bacillus cereus]MDH4420632.1 hypothetical protein [Bacillus cereus]